MLYCTISQLLQSRSAFGSVQQQMGYITFFNFLSLKKGHENISFLFSLPYLVHHKDTPVVFVATLAN